MKIVYQTQPDIQMGSCIRKAEVDEIPARPVVKRVRKPRQVRPKKPRAPRPQKPRAPRPKQIGGEGLYYGPTIGADGVDVKLGVRVGDGLVLTNSGLSIGMGGGFGF